MSFLEFKDRNPEIRVLPLQIQEMRYEHYDKYREQLITKAKEVNRS